MRVIDITQSGMRPSLSPLGKLKTRGVFVRSGSDSAVRRRTGGSAADRGDLGGRLRGRPLAAPLVARVAIPAVLLSSCLAGLAPNRRIDRFATSARYSSERLRTVGTDRALLYLGGGTGRCLRPCTLVVADPDRNRRRVV